MTKKQAKKAEQPQTTAQQLGSLIKSARDIMRKDKGLNGDLDRLPMLTWVMFLKFLDDLEQMEETRAAIGGKKHRPAIEPPYRWRDWAAKKDGITGDELIKFINNDEATRPDGSKGPGLFACLRSLQGRNGDGRRDVIANVFRGVINRMISGYLLRDVVNLVDGIHFNSAGEIHTLSHLYESMLREMRDAAGDSGEFYTPRPVVRFMVEVTDPRLGETVLDPACGTGGFLCESYAHLERQCKTVEDLKVLQEKSIFGGEAKPLPYMLAQMSLLLHGLKSPRIAYGNSLAVKLTEIGRRERVDVIMTNPPFGGEEEAGIRTNFPPDKQTSETALLFLQLIMRKLRRPGEGSDRCGRAAVVVPNGILYGDGVCARIKQELLTEFNLHTIVRLPAGVFAPYTPIPTNLLFFDCAGPTRHIWFYEHTLPNGCKKYTKSNPLQYEEFSDCLKWWTRRKENGRAWKVKASEVIQSNSDGDRALVNLDIRNPTGSGGANVVQPCRVISSLIEDQKEILRIVSEAAELVAQIENADHKDWPSTQLSEVLHLVRHEHSVEPNRAYPNVGIYSYGRGLFQKPPIEGLATSAKSLYRVSAGQFIYSRLFAFEGAYAMVPKDFDGYFVSNEYPTFECDSGRINVAFLWAYFRSPLVWAALAEKSQGLGDRRQRVQPDQVLRHRLKLPPFDWQNLVVRVQEHLATLRRLQAESERGAEDLLPSLVQRAFSSAL